MEENILLLKARGKSIPIVNPKLPLRESPAFYRIVAHMIGDGSATRNHVPYYANLCNELREQFKEDLKIFGGVKVSETTPNTTPIICFPKIITDILSHILKIRFSYPTHIPKDIFSASDKCKSSFLRALFDDEGCSSNGIVIRMKNVNLIKQIGKLIEQIGIKINKISIANDKQLMVTLSINSKYTKDFKEKVGFIHPIKYINLEASINRHKRKQRIRSVEVIEKEIIANLKKGQMRTIEVAHKMQFTMGHTLAYLKKLEKKGRVERSGFKNKLIWSCSKV